MSNNNNLSKLSAQWCNNLLLQHISISKVLLNLSAVAVDNKEHAEMSSHLHCISQVLSLTNELSSQTQQFAQFVSEHVEHANTQDIAKVEITSLDKLAELVESMSKSTSIKTFNGKLQEVEDIDVVKSFMSGSNNNAAKNPHLDDLQEAIDAKYRERKIDNESNWKADLPADLREESASSSAQQVTVRKTSVYDGAPTFRKRITDILQDANVVMNANELNNLFDPEMSKSAFAARMTSIKSSLFAYKHLSQHRKFPTYYGLPEWVDSNGKSFNEDYMQRLLTLEELAAKDAVKAKVNAKTTKLRKNSADNATKKPKVKKEVNSLRVVANNPELCEKIEKYDTVKFKSFSGAISYGTVVQLNPAVYDKEGDITEEASVSIDIDGQPGRVNRKLDEVLKVK